MPVDVERDLGWLLDRIVILGSSREAQLKVVAKFERTARADGIREASKLLLDRKHDSTVDELIDMLDERADKAEDPVDS